MPKEAVVAYDLDKAPGTWVMRQSNRRERRLWIGCAQVVLLDALPPSGRLASISDSVEISRV